MSQKPVSDIDIGLHILCALADTEQTLSAAEIADVRGCANATIYEIQATALKKARIRGLRIGLDDFIT